MFTLFWNPTHAVFPRRIFPLVLFGFDQVYVEFVYSEHRISLMARGSGSEAHSEDRQEG